jgi:hypothetical protein
LGKITCSLKNHITLLPGALYKFDKDRRTDDHHGARENFPERITMPKDHPQ